jgi:anti-anti-sigma regulatory factor
MSEFTIDAAVENGLLVLRPRGYFEKTAGQMLQAELEKHLPAGAQKCLLDLRLVQVITSPGVTKLLELAENLRYERKIPLGLMGVTELYQEIFQCVGLLLLVQVFSDEETARTTL